MEKLTEFDGQREETNGETQDTDWCRVTKGLSELTHDVSLWGQEDLLEQLGRDGVLLGQVAATIVAVLELGGMVHAMVGSVVGSHRLKDVDLCTKDLSKRRR